MSNPIKTARTKNDQMSQHELGQKVGRSAGSISQIEAGYTCTEAVARKIAKALKCDVADLFEADAPTKFRVRREARKGAKR